MEGKILEQIKNSVSLSEAARLIFGSDAYANREKIKKICNDNNLEYPHKPKNYCKECGKEISNHKKFCDSSCAAKYNNKRRKKL